MTKRLSSWWEQTAAAGYKAKRTLAVPAGPDALLEQINVYYCAANFTPQHAWRAEGHKPTFMYLVNGEKEPPNAPEDSPLSRKQAEMVGGSLRKDVPEIIPIYYITVHSKGQPGIAREYTSDQVPLVQNKSRTVRVLAGQFENASHPIMPDTVITLLDVVLNPGGDFSWPVPNGYQAFVYVMGGLVSFGRKDLLPNCPVDTEVAVQGKELYASTQCSGGRLLVVVTPHQQRNKSQQQAYEKVVL